MATAPDLLPAAAAFDAIADDFDGRFGEWASVAAQRRAVRRTLLDAFPEGSRLLEIGGGTGADAQWLAERGRHVFVTDASPAMVRAAGARLGPEAAECLAIEQLHQLAERGERFDGAFSNFAALNCVDDLSPVGDAMQRLVKPGGRLVVVVFGTFCPGEMITELVRGRFGHCFRRFARGQVAASLSGRRFTVRYHRRGDLERALSPWFELRTARAIGLFVPPSAAEPWISLHPRLLSLLEAADRAVPDAAAFLGDHVLYRFERRSER